ncbi:GlxA family transcriptional regulator [Nocardia cyriacigeorgica]|uniref:Multiple antibiotic resistance protein marA n=1 Tax=Nocardia cyriacigeorgica TaxID=135487 RepID=A0A4U8W284_9NOCA|nr:helix-turn-helix domain-containing protein [Nocardia cyriacigeorgica]MBF6096975.1 helix-turn-helix domain-containing protein [Nocardia cyriacigeorgica]MBF6316723.1 helix-turn-helix domain-containing protein [Nocardia cyriacigeorgica]MBF6517855.1 helix-turn-helix domain-containing protein [Nocardia cyriacigeorgica]MBF6534673.1 helix-turn-helix domain-containing protein [Nocardia cyriacigeorgica]VFA98544.1 Multiple antibiotic resistance protein marA [Nocardia cyriacigeorgica]
MTVVAVLAPDSVIGFEVMLPGMVFGAANTMLGEQYYDIRVVTPGGSAGVAAVHGAVRLQSEWDLDCLAEADTVMVPGRTEFLDEPAEPVRRALLDAAARGARLASVCVGAFTLAATGLLDGARATTHWEHAAELARRYPRVEVDPSVLFVDNGSVLTSAGVAAGLDLCLHMVRRDLGARVAGDTARRLVMPPQRGGGQAQFIAHTDPDDSSVSLQPVLDWMQANLHRPLSLDDIAAHGALSVRSLNRRFRAEIGTTPLQWLLRARVHRAQQLLETSDLSIDRIAEASGFGTAATLRYHFSRLARTSPQAYRADFQHSGRLARI